MTFGTAAVTCSDVVADGFQILMRRGKVVWLAKIGDPVEDVDHDLLVLSPLDFESLKRDIAPRM